MKTPTKNWRNDAMKQRKEKKNKNTYTRWIYLLAVRSLDRLISEWTCERAMREWFLSQCRAAYKAQPWISTPTSPHWFALRYLKYVLNNQTSRWSIVYAQLLLYFINIMWCDLWAMSVCVTLPISRKPTICFLNDEYAEQHIGERDGHVPALHNQRVCRYAIPFTRNHFSIDSNALRIFTFRRLFPFHIYIIMILTITPKQPTAEQKKQKKKKNTTKRKKHWEERNMKEKKKEK